MPCRNPWNQFVAEYYAAHKNEQPRATFSHVAVLYRANKEKHRSSKTSRQQTCRNPWNQFVAEYYAAHNGEKPRASFSHVAVLYRARKENHQSSKAHRSQHQKSAVSSRHASTVREHQSSKAHRSQHQNSAVSSRQPSTVREHKGPLYVVAIESDCSHCDPNTPEVFTQEPLCDLVVTESDPIVRYRLHDKEYCALGSNLLRYFQTELVVDSVGIQTRRGGLTAPVGRKRGPVEPYSGLEFSKADYKWIKSRVKLPRQRRGRRA